MHDTNLLEDQPIAWTPTPDVIDRAQLTRFMRQVGVTTWEELYEFSIRNVEKFTEEVLKFLDIKFDPPYSRLLDTSDGIEFPRWFISPPRRGDAGGVRRETGDGRQETGDVRRESEPGAVATGSHAGLNITTMCLDRWQTDEMKDQPAVIWEGENRAHWHWTYEELLEQVEYCANGLRFNGIGKGDAVGIFLPMTQDIATVLMALGRVGAIAVPVFSGYGVEAVVSRMVAVQAKALFTCNGFERRGKFIDALSIAKEAVSRCPTIEKVVVRDLGGPTPAFENAKFEDWHRFMVHKSDLLGDRAWYQLDFPEPTSAEDPLIILYTSGTTGKPKGIAHTHASFPIKAAQDMAFGTDVGRGTRICWYTDIGWMMGPWLIYGALINGATICIYDGAPDYPTPDRMWEFCAKHKVEVLGISPTLVRALAAHEESRDLASTTPTSQSLGHPSSEQEGRSQNSPPVLGGVAAASADGVVPPHDSPPVLGGVAGFNSPPGLRRGADASSAGWSADGVVPPHNDSTKDNLTQSREAAKEESDSSLTTTPPRKASAPLLNKEGSFRAPYERHDLSSLRAFASTGEPWNPAPWWWLFEKVGNSKLPIINYSGGTEIAGGILMGNPLLPIKPCSFPAPCPGMDVDILDENGQPVGPNQVGELVIKQPWIGMARGFWQEKERYLDTYWRRFPNIWVHGDWAMRDKDGHWFILGRSDDTLKVAGKRVGPAEVESLLVAHPLVTEAAVIGVPDEAKGTAMVAFCVIKDESGRMKDEEEVPRPKPQVRDDSSFIPPPSSLEAELKSLVAKDMGKPLAPSKIHFVSAFPKTRNAKVMRRVIRAAYLGEDPGDLSALENPQAVDELRRSGSE